MKIEAGYDYCADVPSASGAMGSGEFNSPILQEAEQEDYLALRKPLGPAKLYALPSQWASC
ncbi:MULTISPECIES: hypothetical protein [unclassified Serratia (in: enterobacteria)]|uniref:hypothetical protein n=1 Tax=unclassified Serratia (in: enterobacteria) TaxID=2647522 RepID=UPI002ED39197|nr:hypothetical protein [Serratia sp. C2(2)]MEE4445274.1 hypothetical protein [Serratia sp. C2(1)]